VTDSLQHEPTNERSAGSESEIESAFESKTKSEFNGFKSETESESES